MSMVAISFSVAYVFIVLFFNIKEYFKDSEDVAFNYIIKYTSNVDRSLLDISPYFCRLEVLGTYNSYIRDRFYVELYLYNPSTDYEYLSEKIVTYCGLQQPPIGSFLNVWE